jgi:hypothetical protein
MTFLLSTGLPLAQTELKTDGNFDKWRKDVSVSLIIGLPNTFGDEIQIIRQVHSKYIFK